MKVSLQHTILSQDGHKGSSDALMKEKKLHIHYKISYSSENVAIFCIQAHIFRVVACFIASIWKITTSIFQMIRALVLLSLLSPSASAVKCLDCVGKDCMGSFCEGDYCILSQYAPRWGTIEWGKPEVVKVIFSFNQATYLCLCRSLGLHDGFTATGRHT